MESLRSAHAASLLLAGLILATLGVVASTWSEFGATWDEPEHLAAGMELLDRGRYDYDLQHPPLARVAIALGPWLAGERSHGLPPPDGRAEGLAILHDSVGYDRTLSLARAGVLPFLALLLWVTYRYARRMLARGAALLAVAFVAMTPTVLGHAGLATLDVPAAATGLLAFYALQCWLDTGRLRDAAAFGLASGVAVMTKLSAIPFIGLGGLLLWALSVLTQRRGHGPSWPGAGLALLGVLAVIVLAYGGGFSHWIDDTRRYDAALHYLFGDRGVVHDLATRFATEVPLPDGLRLMIGGIQALQVHNAAGHLSYLFGEVRSDGWRYFYVVALGVKTPLPLLLAGLAGLVLLAVRGWRRRDAWSLAPALLFCVILAFASGYSRINIGVRHVLVLLPLLAIGAAASMAALAARVRHRDAPAAARGAAAIMLVVMLAWQAWGTARAWPDYLAWFNETTPDPARILVDSDLDWGQDLRRLERRLAARRIPYVSIAYSGSADLAREALPPYRVLAPGVRATGWIAISALARVEGRGGYDWLYAYRPVERIGRTVDLYFVPGPR